MGAAARIWLVGALVCAIAGLSAPVAQGATSFGVTEEHFEAGTCTTSSCAYTSPHELFFTQAAGHPPVGLTGFEFNSEAKGLGKEPIGNVKNVRVDVPPGLAANPEALPKCSVARFENNECPSDTEVGEDEATAFVDLANVTLTGQVYDLEQPEWVPLEFGIHLEVPAVANEHIFLVGHLSWSTDYHEYFEIDNISSQIPLLKSKLIFDGTAGTGFLTLPSECSTSTTSHLRVESYKGEVSETQTHTPVGVEGCANVPFEPRVELDPQTTQSDQPDGATVKLEVPQSESPGETDSSDVKTAVVTLPEGMTLNPAAANGLQACSDAEFGRTGTAKPVACPVGSRIGTVRIETPDLPPKSLTGDVYVGEPEGDEPASGQEYRIFVAVESERYGLSVRLEGHVSANPTTGRLTTTFAENPQLPFKEAILTFEGGAKAPLANPLACGTATTTASLTPYSGNPPATPLSAFAVDFDGNRGACPSPLPFTLTQAAAATPTTAAAPTSFAYDLARADGQQYLSSASVTLPEGLVGKIPAVPLCGEPQAEKGECSAASEIGTASVSAGSGPSPYGLSGTVYLTGPYAGAPYGLSVVVNAEKVGPLDYGRIVTRATIAVNPLTAQVTVASQLPTIVGGVPLRLRTLAVNVDRAGFLVNPTSCAALATTTTLTSTLGATQSLSTPFEAEGCSGLAFKPKLTASSNAKTSRLNGTGLTVKLSMPAGAEANVRSVLVALPKILPARLSTLNHACPEATFDANPAACPPGARVGEATVTTPVLPGKLRGPAIFVSHGGAAFPDLDLVLSGDGVSVVLVGATDISQDVTTSDFATLPDVPVESAEVKLPSGRYSALTAVGNVCKRALSMPTTITAQNGTVVKQSTRIVVSGCPRAHIRRHARHHQTVRNPAR